MAKGPTASQKRRVARLADPLLRMGFGGYRRLFRRGRLASTSIDPRTVKKVLAVRLDAIGDLLLTEPALALLRESYPNARIDLAANPGSAAVLRDNPNVDRIIPYRAPWHASWRGARVDWRRELIQFSRTTRELRAEYYDIGFELRADIRDIIFLAAAAPAVVVGNSFRGGRGLLDIDVSLPADGHQVEWSARIATLGKPFEPPAPRVYLSDANRRKAVEAIPDSRRVIGLHLGAGFPSKCLPIEHFAAVAGALHQHDPFRRFVIVGAPDELPLAEALAAQLPVAPTILTGQLSLLETAAALERCNLFIGNDSAPMHLAAAVGTPVVTFFGPSEPWKFHPYGVPYRLLEVDLDCRPCDYVHCIWPDELRFQCMTHQSVAGIVAAAEELLALPVQSH